MRNSYGIQTAHIRIRWSLPGGNKKSSSLGRMVDILMPHFLLIPFNSQRDAFPSEALQRPYFPSDSIVPRDVKREVGFGVGARVTKYPNQPNPSPNPNPKPRLPRFVRSQGYCREAEEPRWEKSLAGSW